ncbi:hypothetical protein Syun_006256 [Stephania yunnanensis]|uniref:Uncharacterized protein n=1 Tax=Stephania yunnanensis TaxID=152371 RepID=A0AAP0KYW2_9MAGN
MVTLSSLSLLTLSALSSLSSLSLLTLSASSLTPLTLSALSSLPLLTLSALSSPAAHSLRPHPCSSPRLHPCSSLPSLSPPAPPRTAAAEYAVYFAPNEPIELLRRDFKEMQTNLLRVMQDNTLTHNELRDVQGQLRHMEHALMDRLGISFTPHRDVPNDLENDDNPDD